jgi:GNAT superfamily N-acetyltransferase
VAFEAGKGERVVLRPMMAADAEAVARLSGELGYPASAAQIAARFRAVRESSALQPAEVFVACDAASEAVVGWVHVVVPAVMESDSMAEIWGLVVADGQRGRGIGTRLMAAAEDWARGQGCATMRLRSSQRRAQAHGFYQRLGYRVVKTQLAFSRSLSADGPWAPPECPRRPDPAGGSAGR